MAYALLDHPDLGDRRPSAMMAEMVALRFETTPPDSLFLALFLRRLPTSIRDHLAAANHETATAMATHADVLWDARNSASVSMVSEISPPLWSAPLLPPAVHSLLIAAPGRQIAAVGDARRPAAPHLDTQMVKRFAGSTGSGVLTLQTARSPVTGRETRSPPWEAQCSRRPHLSPGFGL
jgi:hypothetical protein